jgi:predicted transposase/invertase (TIGR01784 family)
LYDITKDYLYKEGLEKGKQEGLEKGLEKGKHEVVVNMLRKGTLSPEQIAEFTGVVVEEVKKIAKELKK